jgi:hypothetical protein
MRLTVAWNVWDNYDDLVLGSEILRLQNDESREFESLHLISQGGYPSPPSKKQAYYLDDHFFIGIPDHHDLYNVHVKYKAAFRVLNGIRHAYQYAKKIGDEYAIVTNVDAWCLDIKKLSSLFKEDSVARNAISARVGLVTALDSTWGSHAPFFDDHFIILNIPLCEEYGVFGDEELIYGKNFVGWGGIHYMLMSLVDAHVPVGMFSPYTHLEDCVNHFGEKSGFNLLPWQYQPKYAFLHANCHQDPSLNYLRAAMLRFKGLDRFPEINAYCAKYSQDSKAFFYTPEFVYYRQSAKEWLALSLIRWPPELYRRALAHLKFKRYARLKSLFESNAMETPLYYKLYWHVLPLDLASRRRVGS